RYSSVMVLIEDQRNLNENLQFVNGSKMRILWHFVLLLTVLHAMALYGLYLAIVHPNWKTLMWAFIYGQIGTQAVLIGSHRFYGHKSFKARFIVRLFLNLFQIIAGQ
ncbi:Desaturase 1, partial [Carabus blaptoides fortunei]